ncbi:MAG: GFA family protein, partial [Acidiferrobacterales bacterium]
YIGRAEPELTFFCHCLACQKESGGPFSVELFILRTAVTIDGSLRGYDSMGDSGNKVTRKSCATCNSPIVLEMDGDPEHVCIKAGSLDDSAWLSPQAHIFTANKQPWVRISDDLPQYEGDYVE